MASQSQKEQLTYLFNRPSEPVFLPKSVGTKEVVFDVPPTFVPERYQAIYGDLQNRFGAEVQERIPVEDLKKTPNLTAIKRLDRNANFSLFLPQHRRLSSELIKLFIAAKDFNEFRCLAIYARDQVNPQLWAYAYSVALLHRPDTKNVAIPPLVETFPNKFIYGDVFPRALRESFLEESSRVPIEIPKDYTASDSDIEHRVAYFREDLGINLHHWHWHLVYPFEGPIEIVKKDRRGELFFYMHQQVLARYNFERHCNNLMSVEKLSNFRQSIREGYFPKLDSSLGSRNWPPRFADSFLKDVRREGDQLDFEILDLERWRDRIYSAIHSGAVQDNNGRTIQLSEENGIDILGNMVEASILSPNKNLYGDIHNFGHLAIASCHDSDGRYLEPFAVMGESSTAMRDPVFYRWHAFIDEIFQEHKATLPRYTERQLTFPDVKVTKIELVTQGKPPGELHTYWQKSVVDMQRGLDFFPRGSVLVKFTHLQHIPFDLRITLENTGRAKAGTARVFLGPQIDDRGSPYSFDEHRVTFIELDKFLVPLKTGTSKADRRSTQSSVTIPFERTFRNLSAANRPADGSPGSAGFDFCGCGWPQHMLIPKGTSGSGFPCTLFVMITDLDQDKLPPSQPACSDAVSYCGIRDNQYPDKKPMGFPFDRPGRDGVDRLEDFLTPNMGVLDVKIVHTNRTVDQSAAQIKDIKNRLGAAQ